MQFKISSGLKSIIGKDLITDDFVAIFELVKNSFDAYADRVDIHFLDDAIYVIDNGKGMSKDDIVKKWLFVAYSAKSDHSENNNLNADYRRDLRSKRSAFSGNKGIGRFSCDRLGRNLQIESKSSSDNVVNILNLNWDLFENNISSEFGSVEVDYNTSNDFSVVRSLTCPSLNNGGTVLEITKLRNGDSWTRKKLLRLKAAIAKLIDPFGIKNDFDIFIHCARELEVDSQQIDSHEAEGLDDDSPYKNVVNGKITNLIFERLSSKTTKMLVRMSDCCNYIYSDLVDRGEVVYRIREPNSYGHLKDIKLGIELYYMNTKAKYNFSRVMGVDSVNFGSVFLFNNGFRVYPFGEKDDDSLGLNARKAQGNRRYLGTREILGLIDIAGSAEKFKESSSRDQGLINTESYTELRRLFMDKAVKRLESYVVNVSWKDKLDADAEDLSRIMTDIGKSRVVEVIAKLISGKDIELLDYSETLIDTVNERSSGFESNIASLAKLAERIDSEELKKKIAVAEKRYDELKRAEQESREEAERERVARLEAEYIAFNEIEARENVEKELKVSTEALEKERKKTLFLRKVTSLDLETILEFHHQIGIYSSSMKHLIEFKLDELKYNENISEVDIRHFLEEMSFKNQQILTISRVATVANHSVSSEVVEKDILDFCKQYLLNVVSKYHQINVIWDDGDLDLIWVMKFRPLDLMVIIENLVHNAAKPCASASYIRFEPSVEAKGRLQIEIYDDGNGIDKVFSPNLDEIFDLGVTTTDGSGLGLHHVRQVVNEMGGSITVDAEYSDGAKFIIRFAR
ncbi:hypothetical protein CN03_11555 [Thalassolituus oleivorans]|uniref:ATP-binding protein n=1 Tax=Thalassolituus oleivorans TaxID=187493 RepID=UPI00094941FE|nr:ATP-binding protein [Thalassolituus oleivorans]APR67512.1 hypothetical protein CN03_11555 [Thalassolituus oleivorans]